MRYHRGRERRRCASIRGERVLMRWTSLLVFVLTACAARGEIEEESMTSKTGSMGSRAPLPPNESLDTPMMLP